MKNQLLVYLFILTSCSAPNKLNTVNIDEISSYGTDANQAEFCSDFQLNKEQANSFFQKAKQVSFKKLHDQFDYLPCFVRGKATIKNESCDWEIRAGGTGELICGSKVQYWACDNCNLLFGG
ncbi:hypothetical protein [Aliikangiella maris]|uniref:Uncharacterized protein n=2 Tax=Aliikangiella maris TaxID=3162458 RepID=A0ABV3MVE1_9GAMM